MADSRGTKMKVNNEIDLCEIVAEKAKKVEEIRHRISAALQKSRISYFIRWQEPGLVGKLVFREKARPVFCVNAAQLEDALRICEELRLTNQDVHILGEKSKNKYSL
ncbi:MAG: hypothetical protein J6Z35_09575 [Lachnospiraceae bacterium]|nr:hypothetical protein [Lachnospiraceae bacterium]